MRVTIPITITKAGTPVTPHLVSIHLGGSSNVDVLGYMKADGSIVLFKTGDAAVILDQSGKINFGVDYDETSCFFGDDSEQAYNEFADQYDWMVPSLAFDYNDVDGIAQILVLIADPETGDVLSVAYDICVNMEESNFTLPLGIFVPELDVDPETAFVTTCEVEGRTYLALSVNGIVRPIYDVGGNGGCQTTTDGAIFDVEDCQNINVGGIGMSEMPLQSALGNYWRARSCSMDNVLVTTFFAIEVYMLGGNFVITTEVITDTAGTWYIQPSQFTVNEA